SMIGVTTLGIRALSVPAGQFDAASGRSNAGARSPRPLAFLRSAMQPLLGLDALAARCQARGDPVRGKVCGFPTYCTGDERGYRPAMATRPAHRLLPFVLLPLLAACGGGPQLTPPPTLPRQGSPSSVEVQFTIALPARTAAAARRDPRYVSASTKSAAVTVTPAGGVRAAPVVIACSSTACSGQVPAQVGSDTFAVSLYDAPNATGHLLSTGSAVQTIVLDAANVVSVTFDGVVAGLRVGLSQTSTTRCFATTLGVAVSALDADGNTIVGPGSYVDANGNSLTVTLNDADTSGSTALAQTTLTAPPAQPIPLTYNGKAATQAIVTATAPGVAKATATLAFPASTAHNLYAVSIPTGTVGTYRIVDFPSSASGNVAPLRSFGLSGGPSALIGGLAIDA